MAWRGMTPRQFGVQVEKELEMRTKQITLYLLQQLIFLSPVDQGAYRGNHIVTINGKDYSYDESITDPGGRTVMADGEKSIADIQDAFVEITIQNNLPYGEALEDGHSDQAPIGVYGVAVNNTREKFR